MRSDPECHKKLHALVQAVSEDIPRPEQFTPVSFEQWSAFEMKSPNLVPQGYMIAKEGDKYVGMSTVWKAQKDPKGLYQGLTGVIREYRGRGIAVALKLKVKIGRASCRERGERKAVSEDGIRDATVTGVQTCALPISAFEMKSPNLVPQGYMIAKEGDKYVGMSTVWKAQKDPKGLYQGLTGVIREYRGRGIAVALKLKV